MRRFTQAEDAEIAILWRRGLTLRVIGAQLGRPWSGVQHRVQVMMRRGVLDYGSRSRRPWSQHEVAELRGLWGWHPDAHVARKLGRSLNSVQVKAGRLGLKDTWKGAYCARRVGSIFGVDSKTVGLWITNGFLEGGERGFETAYQDAARRTRCSREDFAAGWVACALHYGISVVFQPDAWREAHESESDTADGIKLP